jgi:hypothetical protein
MLSLLPRGPAAPAALLSLALFILGPPAARGDVLVASAGAIQHNEALGIVPSLVPVFGSAFSPYQMMSPGGLYPTLIGGTEIVHGAAAGPLVPPLGLVTPPVPPSFGGASTVMQATGNPLGGGGILWPSFSVFDVGPPLDGIWSVNVSEGSATLVATFDYVGYFGAILGVVGFAPTDPLTGLPSLVAAGIRGDILIDRPAAFADTLLTPNVIIASDGAGLLPEFSAAFFDGGALGGDFYALLPPAAGSSPFIAYAVALRPEFIPAGTVIDLTGALTLMADPPISSAIIQLNPPPIELPGPVVGIQGGFAPEPSTLVLWGVGLLGLGLYRRCGRARVAG